MMARRTLLTALLMALVPISLPPVVHAQGETETRSPMPQGQGMGGMGASHKWTVKGPLPPPVDGYSEGQKILFLHTEASDPEIAKMLTDMMGSPVLTVPALAKVPDFALANAYVFTNGRHQARRGSGAIGLPARCAR